MLFQALLESAQKGELILIAGGICRWHLRRDKQITIKEIISTSPGAGTEMLRILLDTARSKGATSLFAKCPEKLLANSWYGKKGFTKEEVETLPSGTRLVLWRLPVGSQ